MRNDARPVGHDSPASPVGGDEHPIRDDRSDSRDSVAHDRQSPVVNKGEEERLKKEDRRDAAR